MHKFPAPPSTRSVRRSSGVKSTVTLRAAAEKQLAESRQKNSGNNLVILREEANIVEMMMNQDLRKPFEIVQGPLGPIVCPVYTEEYIQLRRDILLINVTNPVMMEHILLKQATGWNGDSYAVVQRQKALVSGKEIVWVSSASDGFGDTFSDSES